MTAHLAPRAPLWFPPADSADEDGLVAVGGDLSPRRLLLAYDSGIFPWYDEGLPPLWWSPDPRTVLDAAHLHVSRSLARTLRRGRFALTFDRAFVDVMHGCAERRRGGTWIIRAMLAAYERLHRLGHAHSVEVRLRDELVGGLYGVLMGQVFFGESMFSRERDASKAALARLAAIVHAADIERDIGTDPLGPGLNAIGVGGLDVESDDHELLRHGMFVYDALYAWCATQTSASA